MKKLWYVSFFLFYLSISLFMSACDQDCDCEPGYCSEEGIILNIDPRDCACCGGWFIEIGADTLRAWTLPEDFIQNLDPNEFPLPVYLEWTAFETPCLGDEINVACIRRR